VLCAVLAAGNGRPETKQTRVVAPDNWLPTRPPSAFVGGKGDQIAGIGRDNLRLVEVDHTLACARSLGRASAGDLAAGRTPFFRFGDLGTTSSNAFDPVAAIGRWCREHALWLHVDGQWRELLGCARSSGVCSRASSTADSYAFNPHKWMFTELRLRLLFCG